MWNIFLWQSNVTKPKSKPKRKEGRIDAHDFEQLNLYHLLFEEIVFHWFSDYNKTWQKTIFLEEFQNYSFLIGQ